MYRKLVGIMLSVMIAASGCAGASMGTASAGGQGAAEARTDAAGGQESAEAQTDAAGGQESAEARTDAAGGQEAGKAQADAGASADGATAESGAAAENGSTAGTGAEAAPAAGAAAKEISPEDVTVTWEDSRVYPDLTLGRYKVITTYGVKGYEDVPFIRASDYLDILFDGRQKVFVEDGVMKVDMRGARAEIDPETDTVLFENPAGFMSTGAIDGAIIEKNEYNVITASLKNKSVQTESKPVAVDLRGYRMPVIPYDGDILMPFLALQNTFGSIAVNNGLAYNGKDYFNVFGTDQFIMTEENAAAADSPYRKAIYSGPFSTREETSQAYADYGYYSTCLLLDLTFGHKEERNITTFDEYFTRMNAKKALCSTRPAIAMTVELMLFSYLFDSGHDALIGTDSVFGRIDGVGKEEVDNIIDEIKESDEAGELFDDAAGISPEDQEISVDAIVGALLEKGLKAPEIVSLIGWSLWLGGNRPQDYGEERLDYAGDTAVIYFNSFKDDTAARDPSYYLDPVKKEDEKTSSFAFFYNCFEDIKTHDEVKNVVINISDNGGGAAAALVSILGFLSEDGEVKITDRNILAGNYREEWYHVDTNLDGVADDQDGFGGQYDFYIMTSGSSYSCANALPYFAQQGGLADIIGTNPGGGDCVVASFVDAYGYCAYYSGMLKLGVDDGTGFVSNEKATEVDFNMMPSIWDITCVPWFDPEGIADAVHQYKDGNKELVYSEEEKSRRMSDFLQKIFERIEASQADKTE